MDEQRNVSQQPEIPACCLTTRCLVDQATLKRAFRLSGRGSIAFCVVLGVLFLLVFAAFVATRHRVDASAVVALLCGAAEIALGCSLPSRNARIQVRRLKELRDMDSYEETTYCAPDALLFRSTYSQDTYSIHYADVKFIRRDGNLIAMVTKGKQLELLDADRFENGTEADFWRLIAEKRPDLKQPKH